MKKEWNTMPESNGKEDLYINNGLLWVGSEGETRKRSDLLEKHKIFHELLTGHALAQRFKHFKYHDTVVKDKVKYEWYATYEYDAGTMFADVCLEAAQNLFIQNSGTIHWDEEVESIRPLGNHVEILTKKRQYTADKVVVAAGGWLSKLYPDLNIKTVAHMLAVNYWDIKKDAMEDFNPRALFPKNSPNLLVSELDDVLYMIPGVDYPDKVKFGIHKGIPFDPSCAKPEKEEWMDSSPSRHIHNHIPGLVFEKPSTGTTCIYTMSEDENYIIDKHPTQPNVIIAGGMSGTGFKFAAIIGKMVADIVNETNTEELKEFREAFSLGREIEGKSGL